MYFQGNEPPTWLASKRNQLAIQKKLPHVHGRATSTTNNQHHIDLIQTILP